MEQLNAELKGIVNCLADECKTLDKAARRRRPDEGDDDHWLFDLPTVSPFYVDWRKIIESKAFRRTQVKTQVITRVTNEFLNGHIRSRNAHIGGVASIATVIARILGLNTDLCLAIAYGHDIGHTPFGHLGEKFLSKIVKPKVFNHAVFGPVVAEKIERQGAGLNLTHQTLEGMLHHSRGAGDLTVSSKVSAEAAVVMYSDKIAYTFSDIRDIFNLYRGRLSLHDFPGLKEQVAWFGIKQRHWVRKCVIALCLESADEGRVSFRSSETAQRFDEIRKLMYTVYDKVNYLAFHDDSVFWEAIRFLKRFEGVDPVIAFALLCDHEALAIGGENKPELEELSIAEIVPHLRGRPIDFADPDLNW